VVKQPKNRTKLLDELSNVFEKLALESRRGTPIIVEGKKDEETLRRLGVGGEIILIKSIRGLRRKFENRDVRRVILLPDLDKEGEHLLKLVKKTLEGVVREIDVSYWRRLRILKRIGFTEVESMDLAFRKLQRGSRDLPL